MVVGYLMPTAATTMHKLTPLPTLVFAAALALTLATPAIGKTAKPAADPSAPGKPVQVTPEMTGAGIVSSGTVLPPIPAVTGSRSKPVASWGKPLPYPILIADRRNNRLIEVTPDKRIVWEFPSPNLVVYRGNEDVNFSSDGMRLAVSEEDNYDLHIVDYVKREITWTYGVPNTRGKTGTLLNYPDDAHLLEDGKFLTADIRNCRVLIIDPASNQIATQWGQPGKCNHKPPHELAWPNGATPMEGGDILVTEITDAWVSRITREGKVKYSVRAPKIRYPSDTFPTVDGKQLIVADFSKPGRVVIFDPATGKPTWEYFHADGDKSLDHPSIARELPDTGDVLIVDDLHDRVIVVDRKTKEIIWQYGVLGVKGHKPGYLNYPDGVDIDVFRDWRVAPGTAAAPKAP
jgi:DNA-binding beta-propeller fold protein YncE